MQRSPQLQIQNARKCASTADTCKRRRNNAWDDPCTCKHHVFLGSDADEDITHSSNGRNRHRQPLPHARVNVVVVVTQLTDRAAAVLAFKLRYRLQEKMKIEKENGAKRLQQCITASSDKTRKPMGSAPC